MDQMANKLTVFFEEPFWVGVFEQTQDKKLSVAKVTFGAEPRDAEIYDFILKHAYYLQFSPSISTIVKEQKRNPKRIQREIKKQVQEVGLGTKSQQALKLQQQQCKKKHKQQS